MNISESRGHLLTEQSNPASQNLDSLSALEIVDLFNQEDQNTITAIANARQELAEAIEAGTTSLGQGGRLFYVGAGTSGRLGVLDAAECPPTFCTPPELVQGILAGGAGALVRSSESLEDRPEDGATAIGDRRVTNLDIVVGITAGGTTPYVHGALQAAKERGATTVAISCVTAEQVPIDADIDIRLLVGAEILAGSGKVYNNQMIDVSVTNSKLSDRAIRIICDLTDLDRSQAQQLLERSNKKVKLALLMAWTDLEAEPATALLQQYNGNLKLANQSQQ